MVTSKIESREAIRWSKFSTRVVCEDIFRWDENIFTIAKVKNKQNSRQLLCLMQKNARKSKIANRLRFSERINDLDKSFAMEKFLRFLIIRTGSLMSKRRMTICWLRLWSLRKNIPNGVFQQHLVQTHRAKATLAFLDATCMDIYDKWPSNN